MTTRCCSLHAKQVRAELAALNGGFHTDRLEEVIESRMSMLEVLLRFRGRWYRVNMMQMGSVMSASAGPRKGRCTCWCWAQQTQ